MATQEEQWSCPICLDAPDDVVYVSPCMHKFCLHCVLQWAKENSSCALCRQRVNSVHFNVRSEDGFLEIHVLRSDPLEDDDGVEEQGNVELANSRVVAGFPPEAWAAFFQQSVETLEPLLLWIQQELLVGFPWWHVALRQSIIIFVLCHHGLDELPLVQTLQPALRDLTVPVVRQLIEVAVELCGEQMRQYMAQLGADAPEEQDSPATSPGPALSPGGTPTPTPQETPPSSPGGTPASNQQD